MTRIPVDATRLIATINRIYRVPRQTGARDLYEGGHMKYEKKTDKSDAELIVEILNENGIKCSLRKEGEPIKSLDFFSFTNADRIRAMTDEELAEWLTDAKICERVCPDNKYCHGDKCVARVTGWLKQPAKEAT